MIVFLLGYLFILFATAIYASHKQTVNGYLLNDRKTSAFLLAVSNVANYVGAGATIFIVSEIAQGSLVTGLGFVIGRPLSFILFSTIAAKIRRLGQECNAVNISDFFEYRFGPANKLLMSLFQLVFIAMGVSIQVIASSWLISSVLGTSYFASACLLFTVSALYSVVGGIKADILTDMIQFIFIVFLFIILSIFIVISPDFTDSMEAMRSISNPFLSDKIGTAIVLLLTMIVSLIVYPTNWQLTLSSVNEKTAYKACWYSAGLSLIVQSFIIFFGIYALGSLNGISNYNLALFDVINKTTPAYFSGLGLSALLAITMSSLDSLFVAGSSIIFGGFSRKTSDMTIWKVRLTTLLFGGLSFALAIGFPSISKMVYFYTAWGLIPIIATLFGIYKIRVSNKAVFLSMLFSMLATVIIYPLAGFASIWIVPILSILIIFIFR